MKSCAHCSIHSLQSMAHIKQAATGSSKRSKPLGRILLSFSPSLCLSFSCLNFSFCFDSVLGRRRRGSVTTRNPHQYWCVHACKESYQRSENPLRTVNTTRWHKGRDTFVPQAHHVRHQHFQRKLEGSSRPSFRHSQPRELLGLTSHVPPHPCEGCDIVQSDHAPQAGVAQGIFDGDLIRRRGGHQVELEEELDEEVERRVRRDHSRDKTQVRMHG